MNIVELELFSEYKKIKSRTKFEFKEKNILEILGENGSGKSILFELLTDILSYSTLDGDEQNKIMKNKELLFRLKLKIKNKLIVIERLTLSESIRSYIENDEQQLPYNINKDLNIIIYSSAKKSILSETYYRLLLKSKDNLNDNRFNFYIREKIKKIIIIYLFIFKENYLKEIFKGIITINPIKKIKIKFNKSNVENMIFFKKIIGREFENISEEELGMILDDNDIQKIRE
ncbi:MAG: ATP-binding cassette domain-containing protein, partial [Clostridium sp.]